MSAHEFNAVQKPSSDAEPELLIAGMEGADVVYHIAAAVEGFGPWSTFKTTTVDGAASPALSAAL